MRFVSLASGSKGNSYLVQANGVAILLDAGLSGKELARRVQLAGLLPSDISGIFVTHEHADHMKGAAIFAKRHEARVFATEGTLQTPCGRYRAVSEGTDRYEVMPAGAEVSLGELTIRSFSISHDATDPVGYVVEAGGVRLVLASDLGVVDETVTDELSPADALVLESNHCPEMLRIGPYPS